MTSPTEAVLTDLAAEQAELDALVTGLEPDEWLLATPAEGWSILDTIAHLAFFDERVTLAARDPDQFRAHLGELLADYDGYMQRGIEQGRSLGPGETLQWWRSERADALDALAALPQGVRLPWYGPDMSVASAATARLMETWAHGQDIWDGLGREREPTERLRHIALLGQKAFANSFIAHGMDVPDETVRVQLVSPTGEHWVFGPADTPHVVHGLATDFCLLTTQRRHRADLGLVATPGLADEWLDVAQAFAGPPGSKRSPAVDL
ncbi:MAG: hypothetical protein QOK42_2311 [Frankiaceae bacterium]|nr:hypothetical protein [Frankiaceae bacterium]